MTLQKIAVIRKAISGPAENRLLTGDGFQSADGFHLVKMFTLKSLKEIDNAKG